MIKRFLAFAATALLLAACDLPLSSDDQVELRVEATAPTLTITNVGGQTVRYLVFDRSELALAFWGRCTPDQRECATLPPGDTDRISYGSIGLVTPGESQAVVHWWIDERLPDGGYRTVRYGDVVVPL